MIHLNEELGIIEKCNVGLAYDGRFLAMNILVNYEDSGHQDILGGICLYNHHHKTARQSSYAARVIYAVLDALQVDEPQQAVGKYIKVLGTGKGFSFEPVGFKTMSGYGNVKTVMFALKEEEK